MRNSEDYNRFEYLKSLNVRVEIPDYSRKSEIEFKEYRFKMDSYLIHKGMRPDLYFQTYSEMNMTKRFMAKGFLSFTYRVVAASFIGNEIRGFQGFSWVQHIPDCNNNWFGNSVYEPDFLYVRNDKQILLSLQGMSMPIPNSENGLALLQANACKYIGFFSGGKTDYQSWSGELPTQEFIEKFIAA